MVVNTITSQDNSKYKRWKSLSQKKYREKEGSFLVEGKLLIRDGIASGGNLKALIISSEEENLEEAIGDIPGDYEVYSLSGYLFDNLVETENGRLIIGEFEIPKWSLDDIDGNVLVLDRIQDPGNMGTLIRTCDGAGFGGIIALKGSVDHLSGKVVRSAAGSIMRLPIVQLEEGELPGALKSKGLRMMVTTPEEADIYWDEDLKGGVALVIGNEGSGVSPFLQENARGRIKIPMFGEIESLNAGVAGSLVIYETLRQNRQ